MSTVGKYDIVVPHTWVPLGCMILYHMNEYSWDVWYCTTWMSTVGMYDIVPHEWVQLGCIILYHMNEYIWDVWYCTIWMSRFGMYDNVPH